MLMILCFGGANEKHNKAFEKLMTHRFKMSMMGELKFFLGFQVRQFEGGMMRHGVDDVKHHPVGNPKRKV